MSWRAVPIKALQGVKRSDRQGKTDHNDSFSSRPWKQGKMTQEFWSYSLAKHLSSRLILPILPACRKQPFSEMFPMQELYPNKAQVESFITFFWNFKLSMSQMSNRSWAAGVNINKIHIYLNGLQILFLHIFCYYVKIMTFMTPICP